jgi:WhiB family redox-sensing transcriptional regulator
MTVELPFVDQPWADQALCAQTDPEAFFPEKGGSTRDAKKICVGCMVRAECLTWALDHEQRFGIWGGLSERERRKLGTKRIIACTIGDCTAMFAAQKDRNRHITLRHHLATKANPVTCLDCGKDFPYLSALRRHAKTHRTNYGVKAAS